MADKIKSEGRYAVTEYGERVYRFWQSNIIRAKKAQPTSYWETARKRYKAECEDPKADDTRPFVNDLRKQHESSMAFLDQQEPSFKVSPSDAFVGDESSEKQAECEAKYLKFVWKEQKCQKVQSRKLNNAVLINNGNSLVQFDVKKWMPSLRFLPAENVLIDPSCNGIIEDAGWMGYWEDIAPEEFKSWHPDMPKNVFKEILTKAGSVLSDEQVKDVVESDIDMFKAIKVYHIFARNSYAIREETEGGDIKEPDKRLAEQLQLDTPRRYIQLVDGWKVPVVDENVWPFDLDHDEFPPSHLQFNQTNGDMYGFTDYQQMSRMDELSDEVMDNVGISTYWAAVKKWGGTNNLQITKEVINNFLNNPKESYLPDSVDQVTGKSKIIALERGYIDVAQMEAYKLIHEQAKEASAMSELLENAEAQAYKDVTAIAARIVDANMHQRINRRLGGPWGYEASIAEDAIKMLEIAHQFVPQVSQVAVIRDFPVLDPLTSQPTMDLMTGQPITEKKEDVVDLPWPEALKAIGEGGQLIKLGIDAIVGLELAQYWPYKQPPQQWRLSTKVIVEPGTTRSITREQEVAVLKQLYVEIYQPFFEATGRLDLAREFLELIGRLANIPIIDSILPKGEELRGELLELQQLKQQFMMLQQEIAMKNAAEKSKPKGEAGGQPLNSPEATGGELQEESTTSTV